MNEPVSPPPPPPTGYPQRRRYVPPSARVPRPAQMWFFAIVASGCAAAALYMGFIVGHPLTSPYVVAPGVGALWFALRLFMLLAPKI